MKTVNNPKVSVKTVYHIDGVYIRMIVNRRTKSEKLFKIDKEFFKDGQIISSHPQALRLNLLISQGISRWTQKALDIKTGLVEVNEKFEEVVEKDKLLSQACLDYAKRQLKLGRYKSYRKYLNIKDKIVDSQDVLLSETNIGDSISILV